MSIKNITLIFKTGLRFSKDDDNFTGKTHAFRDIDLKTPCRIASIRVRKFYNKMCFYKKSVPTLNRSFLLKKSEKTVSRSSFCITILENKCKFSKVSIQCHPLLNVIQIMFA